MKDLKKLLDKIQTTLEARFKINQKDVFSTAQEYARSINQSYSNNPEKLSKDIFNTTKYIRNEFEYFQQALNIEQTAIPCQKISRKSKRAKYKHSILQYNNKKNEPEFLVLDQRAKKNNPSMDLSGRFKQIKFALQASNLFSSCGVIYTPVVLMVLNQRITRRKKKRAIKERIKLEPHTYQEVLRSNNTILFRRQNVFSGEMIAYQILPIADLGFDLRIVLNEMRLLDPDNSLASPSEKLGWFLLYSLTGLKKHLVEHNVTYHGDLKPSNMLLTQSDRPFKYIDDIPALAKKNGVLNATRKYLPPESFRKKIDGCINCFSLSLYALDFFIGAQCIENLKNLGGPRKKKKEITNAHFNCIQSLKEQLEYLCTQQQDILEKKLSPLETNSRLRLLHKEYAEYLAGTLKKITQGKYLIHKNFPLSETMCDQHPFGLKELLLLLCQMIAPEPKNRWTVTQAISAIIHICQQHFPWILPNATSTHKERTIRISDKPQRITFDFKDQENDLKLTNVRRKKVHGYTRHEFEEPLANKMPSKKTVVVAVCPRLRFG
jgi:serine/threonine protein kinase